jgi:5-formyltetrahydrofolate cyclo-ligase
VFNKLSLRKKFSEIRSHISNENQNAASIKAAENFFEKIPLTISDIVSAYYPINNEISPLPILEKLKQRNIKTALPEIIKNSPLLFRQWQIGDALDNTKIPQPLKTPQQVLPTIIIVPLLAFDKNNHRLGYGGGYFDRTISHLKNSGHKFITVGLAYAVQKYDDDLPIESNDMRLDFIVTD